MTTLRTPPRSKLGIDLQTFRTDRPDEWRMDEFTRNAEDMQARINELEKTILETLDENGHLADGDVCTLIKLKRVMGL